MKNTGNCILLFLGGALAGAAAALFFSPKCGLELRNSIKGMIDKEIDAMKCHCPEHQKENAQ